MAIFTVPEWLRFAKNVSKLIKLRGTRDSLTKMVQTNRQLHRMLSWRMNYNICSRTRVPFTSFAHGSLCHRPTREKAKIWGTERGGEIHSRSVGYLFNVHRRNHWTGSRSSSFVKTVISLNMAAATSTESCRTKNICRLSVCRLCCSSFYAP